MRPTAPPPSAADIDRRFREAVALHQSGDAAAAAAHYEALRRQVPEHPELLHLFGTALVQLGRTAEAVPILDKSLLLRPSYGPTLEIAGTAHLLTGNAERASTLLKQACTLLPRSDVLLMRLGDACLGSGQHEAARAAFQNVLTAAPGRPDASVGLATALANLKRYREAEDTLRMCIKTHPTFVKAYVALSTILAQQEQYVEAEQVIRAGLKIQPTLATGQHLLAKTLHRQGRTKEAEGAYLKTFDLGLRDPVTLTECAELLMEDGQLDKAEAYLREALTANPESADTITALGRVAEFRGALDEALALHERAITLDANNANAYVDRGTTKRFRGDNDGALADFDRALALKPGLPAAIASRGITLLSLGRLREGWPDFKARLRAQDGARNLTAGHPWNGNPLDGKRVLVWTEYGLGDEIMAASLLPEILDRTAHCTLACSDRLVSVFQRAFPRAEVVQADAPITGDFDARLPLLDAAQWLRPTFDSFPNRNNYLTADAALAKSLRRRYEGNRHKLVGISWRSAAIRTGAHKSMRLTDWAQILEVPGIRFVSLQYGAVDDEIRDARAKSGADIIVDAAINATGDMENFAAQTAAMDLVVSASNTTVHMAGALGKPTWLLAPEGRGTHWYWFKERTDNPWYPTMRLFRQKQIGEWSGAIAAVAARLRDWQQT